MIGSQGGLGIPMTWLARNIGLVLLPAPVAALQFSPAYQSGGHGGVDGSEFVFAIDRIVYSMTHISLPPPLHRPDHDGDRLFGFGLGVA